MHDLLVREVVERMALRSPPPAGCGMPLRRTVLLRLGQIPGRQHIGAVGALRPHRVAVAPQLVVPVGDLVVGDRARRARSSTSPRRKAPSRTRRRASIAAAPAGRWRPAPATPRRAPRRRRRSGRSSPSPRHGCSGCSPAGIFSDLASSARSGNTPCEWVQTVSLPSLNSASAADGPDRRRAPGTAWCRSPPASCRRRPAPRPASTPMVRRRARQRLQMRVDVRRVRQLRAELPLRRPWPALRAP